MEIFPVIAAERRTLVDRLRGLTVEQWDAPSLCDGWAVRHVLAHLITPFEVSVPKLMVYMARGRGLPGAMDFAARAIDDRRSPDEMLQVLADHAESHFTPPGQPPEAPLTDAVCHAADIRWALGDSKADWGSDPERLRPSLDYLMTRKAGAAMVRKGRLDGLRLVASDQSWAHGDGAEVTGTSLALALAVVGREAAFSELSGDGVGLLAGRG